MQLQQHDLIELYQLAKMYCDTYGVDSITLQDIASRYSDIWHEDIALQRNPRHAGRPSGSKKYDTTTDNQIRQLRADGLTVRAISQQTGCSLGYISQILASK